MPGSASSSALARRCAGSARRVQKDYYLRYGTTMRGMMTERRFADDYLAYVHKIDPAARAEPGDGGCDRKLPGETI
jgi:putative hydrolase of the HAD superfamily